MQTIKIIVMVGNLHVSDSGAESWDPGTQTYTGLVSGTSLNDASREEARKVTNEIFQGMDTGFLPT